MEAAIHSLEDGFNEWVCFQSVQAVEKALKSVILHGSWQPPRTHKLAVLIGLANNVNKKFKEFKFKFRDLEVFTYVSRYPSIIPNEKRPPHEFITKEDGEKCQNQAKIILDKLNEMLDPNDVGIDYKDSLEVDKIDINARIKAVTEVVMKKLNPELILLFGSYGRGEDYLSTMDLLIIAETDKSFIERVHQVRELTKGGLPPVQPIIYTPEEYELLKESDLMLSNALQEGRILYKKMS